MDLFRLAKGKIRSLTTASIQNKTARKTKIFEKHSRERKMVAKERSW
tara:strand:+ start:1197 stop:1337 length:141 start_codon:yes stop_codon:yes gene_type:complete